MSDTEKKEAKDDVKLPVWYLKIENIAGKLAAGCIAAEISLNLWAKSFISQKVIDIINLPLILFGIFCIVFSGYKALGFVGTILDIIKKTKT